MAAETEFPGAPARDAVVAWGACVDRVLSDLSVRFVLAGRVEIWPLPTVHCDPALVRRVLLVLLEGVLELTEGRARLRTEWDQLAPTLVLECTPLDAARIDEASHHLTKAGGILDVEATEGPRALTVRMTFALSTDETPVPESELGA